MVQRALVVGAFLTVVLTSGVLAFVAGSLLVGLFFVFLACGLVTALPFAARSKRRARGSEERPVTLLPRREDDVKAPRRAA